VASKGASLLENGGMPASNGARRRIVAWRSSHRVNRKQAHLRKTARGNRHVALRLREMWRLASRSVLWRKQNIA
jgi:hypothetical protein